MTLSIINQNIRSFPTRSCNKIHSGSHAVARHRLVFILRLVLLVVVLQPLINVWFTFSSCVGFYCEFVLYRETGWKLTCNEVFLVLTFNDMCVCVFINTSLCPTNSYLSKQHELKHTYIYHQSMHSHLLINENKRNTIKQPRVTTIQIETIEFEIPASLYWIAGRLDIVTDTKQGLYSVNF